MLRRQLQRAGRGWGGAHSVTELLAQNGVVAAMSKHATVASERSPGPAATSRDTHKSVLLAQKVRPVAQLIDLELGAPATRHSVLLSAARCRTNTRGARGSSLSHAT